MSIFICFYARYFWICYIYHIRYYFVVTRMEPKYNLFVIVIAIVIFVLLYSTHEYVCMFIFFQTQTHSNVST